MFIYLDCFLFLMTLTKELLDMLACPDCRGRLELQKSQKFLQCVQCSEIFEIRDGIPILLPQKE